MQNNDRLKQLLNFLEQQPNDPFLQYALATEYLRNDKLELALFYYEGLIKNHQNYIGTYYHLGKLYEQIDRKDDAIHTYEAGMVIAKNAKDMHSFSELQNVYQAMMGINDENE